MTESTSRFNDADGTGRGTVAGAEGPTLARARVSVGLSLGLENVPRGKGLGGEEPARVEYRWPPVSPFQQQELSGAYEALTGRRVWRGVLPLLILARRRHGPDTISLLRELHQEGGVQDLLARLLAYPPRQDPHPSYVALTLVPAKTEPAGPPPTELAQAEREGADQTTLGGPPATPEGQERTPERLTGSSVLINPRLVEAITPELPSVSLADSTPHQDGRRAASLGGPECREPSGPDSSPADPLPAQRSRPPDCLYPRHEPTWRPRPDGTMRCTTCHP